MWQCFSIFSMHILLFPFCFPSPCLALLKNEEKRRRKKRVIMISKCGNTLVFICIFFYFHYHFKDSSGTYKNIHTWDDETWVFSTKLFPFQSMNKKIEIKKLIEGMQCAFHDFFFNDFYFDYLLIFKSV